VADFRGQLTLLRQVSNGVGAAQLVPAVAAWAARQPTGDDAGDGESGGDEAVVEMTLRPRSASVWRLSSLWPRGENAAHVQRR
jgi:hypothetical protein